jgi:sialidase-1
VGLSSSNVGVQQVLFRSGTAGYGCFRIPALVKTKSDSLLAFAEARKSPSCGDRGDIDLVVRRSTNGGRTWGPIRVVLAGSDVDPDAPFTRGNAAPVVDETTGHIFLVSTSNPDTFSGKRLPWVQESDDDGISWSAARAMGTNFSGSDGGWFATGPSHGIQLRNGAHAGRLVVGAHQVANATTVYDGVLYSDDHGDTWQASRAANSYIAQVMTAPGEVSVAELPDGSVYAAARNPSGSSGNYRTKAVSIDGGTTMPALTTVPSLVGPDVQGAVLTLRETYQSQPGDTLIYSGPSDPDSRDLLKIRYSKDRGVTWQSPSNGLITNDRSGYSDVAELADGEIGVLYEGGAVTDEFGKVGFSADEIRFTRFTPAQIGLPGTFTGTVFPQTSPAAAPTSPDATPEANDAFLRGNAALSSGRFGQGLSVQGNGDHAEIPYASTIDPGAGDFTYSTWFKYTATTANPNQVLFWGYGVGAGKPQLWVRAQPSQDRLLAWVQGDSGGATVSLTDDSSTIAFGDDAWHHLSLVRSGGQITLTVDGTISAFAAGVAGSVSDSPQHGVEGLLLGEKPDITASDPFTGDLDEFRFYRQALTGDQLNQVRTGNVAVIDADPEAAVNKALGLRLPFQVVDTATTPTRVRVAIADDMSGHCASATLLGGEPHLTTGHNGAALAVDSAHPGAEVPFLPTLDLGSGDFTYTTWFQYSATSSESNQVLLWAYGMGAGQRQIWLRAQPSQDRLYAMVQTDTGQVTVTLKDGSSATAFGNGTWHLLALTRSGGQIQLSVDGGTPASASGLTGSVTANAAAGIEGLRVGSKPDGTDVLTGNLDEFRLYRRALTATELDSLVAGYSPADNPAVQWTFDYGYSQAHNVVRPSPASGPATPDSSAHCNNAYVRGGATPTAGGKFGAALALDGVDDTVQVPYNAANVLGSADFTISTWLKYNATPSSSDKVLLWAYGAGATERQIWLRAKPSQDQLYLVLETETATTTLTAVDSSPAVAFGDGQWHHIALRRSSNTLSLTVDGAVLDSDTIAAGSVTYGDTFVVNGFQLGAKPDGADRFNGSLDEFRIFRKSLTAAELDDIRLNNTDLGTVTSIRLPFDVVTAGNYARM